jgi:predicted AAA+ superfamily ATPase
MYRMLEKELLLWKNNQEHIPILLRGARQVGKSFLVEKFGKTYFENIAIVDFEYRPELKQPFIESREPKEILTRLEFLLDLKIRPNQTLLFLDEIQSCPQALISLRYFKEKLPDLHIIAAGSLLEFLIHDQNFSFPVGRVEFLYLKPFSFFEFLSAISPIKAERLSSFSIENPPSNAEHQELLKLVRRYLFIGGMPAAINAFLKEDYLQDSTRVHARILQAYENDFGKYAKVSQHKYLQSIFKKAPSYIAQVLKYARLDPEAKTKDLKLALDALCHTQLLQKIFYTNAAGLPLHAHIKEERFKLLYLDVGLLQTTTQIDASHFFEKDILQINTGVIAEQFVGQELLAYENPYTRSSLLFWENYPKGDAEIDYILEKKGTIIPIEVKAGSTGSLKSLHYFMQQKNIPYGIRISDLPLKKDKNILSIPFYLISELERIYLENL